MALMVLTFPRDREGAQVGGTKAPDLSQGHSLQRNYLGHVGKEEDTLFQREQSLVGC